MNPGLYFTGPRSAALAIYLLAGAFILPAMGGHAAADELDTLYSHVMQRPSDSELNLKFAQLAEDAGKLRWALSAYERVNLNDPNNTAAQEGLQRIRRKLQPSTTLMTVQLGAQYEFQSELLHRSAPLGASGGRLGNVAGRAHVQRRALAHQCAGRRRRPST